MQRFAHAFRGIRFALLAEPNFRVHVPAGLLVFGLAVWLGLPATHFALLALTVGGVFVAELLNTAVENTVDLASPEHHELAKRAKDTAAGAVLAAAISSVLVGACVLGPPLWERIAG
ncbi:MAG: diacylglycerol kinase family protein [Planctomycetaceae bacterium]